MLSLPAQLHCPAPVVNVCVCLLVCTVTVAGLPFGAPDTEKLTLLPDADVPTDRLFSGPYVTTCADWAASHGFPVSALPLLPLQACRFTATFCPFGNPLIV